MPTGIPQKRNLDKDGYIRLSGYKGHPNAWKQCGRIYEHVLIMTEALGRPLFPKEEVHHKNGIRDDNRLENLELWDCSQPKGQRVEDKLEFYATYLELHGWSVTRPIREN